jgi:hypothetical protein
MLMDSNRINELLTKYWNCETSLEEEHELQEHFRAGNVAEEHKETATLFRYFDEIKKKSLDASFDGQVIAKVGERTPGKVIKLLHNSMRIAAGVTVLMIAIWTVRTEIRKNTQEIVDTYNDPKLAFEETKKALLMISKSFGKAEEGTKKINLFNEAQEEIQKQDKQLQ